MKDMAKKNNLGNRDKLIKPFSCEQRLRNNLNIQSDYNSKRRKFSEKENGREKTNPDNAINSQFMHNNNHQNNILSKKSDHRDMSHEFELISNNIKNKDHLGDYFGFSNLNIGNRNNNNLDAKNSHNNHYDPGGKTNDNSELEIIINKHKLGLEVAQSRINNKDLNLSSRKKKKEFMVKIGTDNRPYFN